MSFSIWNPLQTANVHQKTTLALHPFPSHPVQTEPSRSAKSDLVDASGRRSAPVLFQSALETWRNRSGRRRPRALPEQVQERRLAEAPGAPEEEPRRGTGTEVEEENRRGSFLSIKCASVNGKASTEA